MIISLQTYVKSKSLYLELNRFAINNYIFTWLCPAEW